MEIECIGEFGVEGSDEDLVIFGSGNDLVDGV